MEDMVFSIILSLIVLGSIVIFSFPQFSPIPYYPSNMKDKGKILKALKLKNNQTVIDLGAGDGVVVFEAAREALQNKLSTRFVALELNPILVLVLHLRRLLHPNRKNIRIVWGDMFKADYRKITEKGDGVKSVTFYLYISPWLIEKAIAQALSSFPDADFVSYYYPIKSMKDRQRIDPGVHMTYAYPKS